MTQIRRSRTKPDTLVVRTGPYEWDWGPSEIGRAVLVSAVCRESRRTRQLCDCTACRIARFVAEEVSDD